MQINSINTNLAAFAAQANIRTAQTATTTSVARLSSGNKITQASDDVAGLSIGTSLATNVSTLRTALVNASQGISLLQVADAALNQVTEILQRQKAIAVQAGSGTLGDTERAFLDAEFQALTSEIDRIATNTNFNGVALINGGLDSASLFGNTSTQATAGSLTVAFSDNITDTGSGDGIETVEINGVTLTAEVGAANVSDLEFHIGATLAETVENLAARLNLLATDNSLISSGFTAANKLALSEAKYEAVGSNLVITSRTGGELSSSFVVDISGATTSATTNGEAVASGDFSGTSFNLFSTTAITTRTQVISGAGTSSTVPFDTAESLTLQIAGVTHTLYTFGTGDTFDDLVNGINANTVDTGVSAAAVFDGTNYNVRLSYESQNGVAIINAGATFNSTTYKLTGDNLENAGANIDVGADNTSAYISIVATDGYENLFETDLNATNVPSQTETVTEAVANVDATDPLAVGDLITAQVNGVTHVLHTLAANDGLDNIVTGINAGTATHGIYAVVDEVATNTLNVRLYVSDPSGRAAANGLLVDTGANANAAAAEVTTNPEIGNATSGVTRVSEAGLTGGADDGLGIASVGLTASSTVGDDIITDLSTVKANSEIIFSANATAGDTITIGSKVFQFTATATASAASNEILIGSTIADTLDNAVATINKYAATDAIGGELYVFNQINVTRDGDTLVIGGKHSDNVLSVTGAAVTVASSDTTNTSVTSANLSNAATTFGLKVDGVSNSAFAGTLSGFTATYTGTTDQATLSIKVGSYTYTAEKVDLTISSNTTIRFISDTLSDDSNGGYFDLQLKASEINSVTSQSDADAVADRLNAAFSGLDFIQKRNVSSYAAGGAFAVNGTVTGSLLGTSVSAQLDSFDNLNLTDISVATASGSATDATLSLTVGGVVYTSENGIGTTLGGNQTYTLVSALDADQFIEFTTGNTAISITNADRATAFENALRAAFGAGSGSAALNFQVGTDTTDTLSISIQDSSTTELFEGTTLNVLTATAAATAVATIDSAIENVTSIRASVGALQSRFNFAAANVESSIQNQDAARGTLLDTDIADESTVYAINQVKLQAGISVLAQANQQLQSLLKLIG